MINRARKYERGGEVSLPLGQGVSALPFAELYVIPKSMNNPSTGRLEGLKRTL